MCRDEEAVSDDYAAADSRSTILTGRTRTGAEDLPIRSFTSPFRVLVCRTLRRVRVMPVSRLRVGRPRRKLAHQFDAFFWLLLLRSSCAYATISVAFQGKGNGNVSSCIICHSGDE